MELTKIIWCIENLLDGHEVVAPDGIIIEKYDDARLVYAGRLIWRTPICGVYPERRTVLVSVYGENNLKPSANFSLVEKIAHEVMMRDITARVIPATRIDALVDPLFADEALDEFVECYESHLDGLIAWLEAKSDEGIKSASVGDVEDFLRIAKIRDAALLFTLAVLGERAWETAKERFRAENCLGREKANAALAAIGKVAGF